MNVDFVVIGGSAGSLTGVLGMLSALHTPLHFPVLLVFHRKNTATEDALIQLLQSKSKHPVKEAEDKECIEPGKIYVAPAGYHLLIESDKSFSLDVSEKLNFSRPSIDITFMTAAEVYQKRMIAIILSGANSDGTNGLLRVKECGGFCIAQEPSTAQVAYMPTQAIQNGAIDLILSPARIFAFLNKESSIQKDGSIS